MSPQLPYDPLTFEPFRLDAILTDQRQLKK
jgi:hypothetical protein